MSATCRAERLTMREGVTKRCGKKVWGQTPFCYQHAIANGHAVVISAWQLAVATARVLGTDEARRVGPALWTALEEARRG